METVVTSDGVALGDDPEAASSSGVPHFAMASHPNEFVALTLDFLT